VTTHQGEHIVKGWEGQGFCNDINTKMMMPAEFHEEPDKDVNNKRNLLIRIYLMTQR